MGLCFFTCSTAPKGAHHLCSSLQAAFDLLSTAPVAESVEKIFVIGGAAVYKVGFHFWIHVR